MDVEAFAGLDDEASWTWQDQADDTHDLSLDLDLLLHGRHEGDGWVSLRRGQRWSDGEDVGHLEWSVDDGLVLASWSFGAQGSEDPVTLIAAGGAFGDVVDSSGWQCESSAPGEVDTFYGLFEDALLVVCSGDAGLAGDFSFARGRGLVRLDGAVFFLDLVRP